MRRKEEEKKYGFTCSDGERLDPSSLLTYCPLPLPRMAPQSPTNARRRRPFPSPSISKSPDSDPLARPKRLKQEDIDHGVDGHAPSVASSTSSTSNGRARRKTKEREKGRDKGAEKDHPHTDDPPADAAPDGPQAAPEEEENGVTRCICGSTCWTFSEMHRVDACR
jgi:hypothetical protein